MYQVEALLLFHLLIALVQCQRGLLIRRGCSVDVFLVSNRFIAVGFACESGAGYCLVARICIRVYLSPFVSPVDCDFAASERPFDWAWLQRRCFLGVESVPFCHFAGESCAWLLHLIAYDTYQVEALLQFLFLILLAQCQRGLLMGFGCGVDVFLVSNRFVAVGFARESCGGLLFGWLQQPCRPK